MRIVIDIEANRLVNPDKIWCIVCKDLDTGRYHIFRKVTEDATERAKFIAFADTVSYWIGHNVLGYDWSVILSCLDYSIRSDITLDTLIVSKLVDYSRQGHSIEDYGKEFGLEKGKFNDFSKWSQELETYCIRDVDIAERIYRKYKRYVDNPEHSASIRLEHSFQLVCNSLNSAGFSFNVDRAQKLLDKVTCELEVLDKDILEAFPPKLKLIREIHPKETKYGTLSKTDFRWHPTGDLSEFNGGPFCRCSWDAFNPSSHKQIVHVLSQSGWRPIDRTQTHIEAERELSRLKYARGDRKALDITKNDVILRLQELRKTGWKVNEANLETLPPSAPKAAKLLARRILLEARRRTLTEWLNLTVTTLEVEKEDITAICTKLGTNEEWKTQSLEKEKLLKQSVGEPKEALTKLNQTIKNNIIKETSVCPLKMLNDWLKDRKINVLSVRESKRNSVLITAIGQEELENFCAGGATEISAGLNYTPLKYKIISQRIHGRFYGIGAWSHRMAHQNPNTANIPNEFDTAGKRKLLGKELRSLWCAPKNRLLVGVDAEGIQLRIFAHYINDPEFTDALVKGKKDDKTDPHSLNQRILGSVCKSRSAAKRFIYALLLGAGMSKLSEILGCSDDETKEALGRLMGRYHGWQQLKSEVFPTDARRGWFTGLDGRKVKIPGDTDGGRRHLAMSGYLQNGEAVCMKLATMKWWSKLEDYDALLVNFVHDEWQTECPNNMEVALAIARMQADSLREVGEDLGLKCPLAGSFWNDDLKDYTIDTNWSKTH